MNIRELSRIADSQDISFIFEEHSSHITVKMIVDKIQIGRADLVWNHPFYKDLDNHLLISSISVNEEGKGYGTKLLNYIVDKAKDLGYSNVVAYPDGEEYEGEMTQSQLQDWYRKNGFIMWKDNVSMYKQL